MEDVRYTIHEKFVFFLSNWKCVDFVYLLTDTPMGYIIKA